MKGDLDPQTAVRALRRAIPYLRPYQGKTFVIKGGGDAFRDEETTRALVEQVGVLHRLGIRVVLVHGGGPQASDLAESLGVEVRFVEGRRVTDERMLDTATMVLNGTLNTRILAACRELEVPASGTSGVDAGLIRAKKRPPKMVKSGERVDYGFVGDIEDVDATVLETLLDGGIVPVVSPLSAADDGTLLNVNADVVAARLARALGAVKLILLTGARGILMDPKDPSTLVSYTDTGGLDRLEDAGAFQEGMLPKAAAIRDALLGGVDRVHVISHSHPDSLLVEVFTNEGSGTMVVRDKKQLLAAEAAAQAGDDEW